MGKPKRIMKPSSEIGAFVTAGDRVEFEVPTSSETILVSAVEINLKSGEAIIHGVDNKGNEWIIPARNLLKVWNKTLTISI